MAKPFERRVFSFYGPNYHRGFGQMESVEISVSPGCMPREQRLISYMQKDISTSTTGISPAGR